MHINHKISEYFIFLVLFLRRNGMSDIFNGLSVSLACTMWSGSRHRLSGCVIHTPPHVRQPRPHIDAAETAKKDKIRPTYSRSKRKRRRRRWEAERERKRSGSRGIKVACACAAAAAHGGRIEYIFYIEHYIHVSTYIIYYIQRT